LQKPNANISKVKKDRQKARASHSYHLIYEFGFDTPKRFQWASIADLPNTMMTFSKVYIKEKLSEKEIFTLFRLSKLVNMGLWFLNRLGRILPCRSHEVQLIPP
jgi:hypothetical protein